MWQAGWHFTQWQHIARSLLSLSPTCLCRRLFSLFLYLCLSHFLFWSFFLKRFSSSSLCNCVLFSFFPFMLLFFTFWIDFSFFPPLILLFQSLFPLSLTLSQSPLALLTLWASNGCVEKLGCKTQTASGEFLSSCVHVWAYVHVHYGVSCLFYCDIYFSGSSTMTHIVLQLLRCEQILKYQEYFIPCIAAHSVYEECRTIAFVLYCVLHLWRCPWARSLYMLACFWIMCMVSAIIETPHPTYPQSVLHHYCREVLRY